MKELLLEVCLIGVILCLLMALLIIRQLIPKKRS